MVSLDLSLAFDIVDHTIPLNKLLNYGIRDRAYSWFSSSLTNRIQYVEMEQDRNSYRSEYLQVQTEVTQGSVLAPLLFLIFGRAQSVALANHPLPNC